MRKRYVMVMRGTGFWLVGPFDGISDAHHWATDPVNNPADDPRWQALDLLPEQLELSVFSPQEAPKR